MSTTGKQITDEHAASNQMISEHLSSENTRDYTHQHHSWGNWGITTTAQKLMEQEFRIRAFDIYEHMADFFLDELCVRVYL